LPVNGQRTRSNAGVRKRQKVIILLAREAAERAREEEEKAREKAKAKENS
jgi:ribosomal protein S13